MKQFTRIWPLFSVVILAGCFAGGSHVITGKPRPAFLPSVVQVYNSMPEKAEQIGVVTAVASQWTAQQDSDRCLSILKSEAAKIGANGLVELEIKQGGSEGTKASAKAIFVP